MSPDTLQDVAVALMVLAFVVAFGWMIYVGKTRRRDRGGDKGPGG
jgi:hypothetical protein